MGTFTLKSVFFVCILELMVAAVIFIYISVHGHTRTCLSADDFTHALVFPRLFEQVILCFSMSNLV